jgi:hypothetical protein
VSRRAVRDPRRDKEGETKTIKKEWITEERKNKHRENFKR